MTRTGSWEAAAAEDFERLETAPAAARTYTITIFFTANPGGTVLGTGATKVTVQPGATEKWTVSAKFPATKSMNCVLRGVA